MTAGSKYPSLSKQMRCLLPFSIALLGNKYVYAQGSSVSEGNKSCSFGNEVISLRAIGLVPIQKVGIHTCSGDAKHSMTSKIVFCMHFIQV